MKIKTTEDKQFLVTNDVIVAVEEIVTIRRNPVGITLNLAFGEVVKISGDDAEELWDWFAEEF
jgi:hypothetical protein